MGTLETLRDSFPEAINPEARELVSSALTRAHDLSAMVGEVLNYARLGSAEIVRERVKILDLIQRAMGNLADVISDANAQIVVEGVSELVVNGVLLTQVFQNLIENAVKYRADRAPYIRISATNDTEGSILTVHDNGRGFDPSKAEDIFRPFFRLSLPGSPPGSGLGLASCRKIVELHGGRIWAESRPGEGSSFSMLIPYST